MDSRSVGRHLLVCGIVEGEILIFNCYNNEHQSSKLKWCDSKDSKANTKFCCGTPIRTTRCDAVRRGLCYGDENADIQSLRTTAA